MFVFHLVDNWEELNQHTPYILETRLKCVPESIYWKIYPEEHMERQFITFYYINAICKTQKQKEHMAKLLGFKNYKKMEKEFKHLVKLSTTKHYRPMQEPQWNRDMIDNHIPIDAIDCTMDSSLLKSVEFMYMMTCLEDYRLDFVIDSKFQEKYRKFYNY